MSYKNLTIINNEKISSEENNFYCDNIDIKTIPEELNKTFQVKLIARKSKYKQVSKINLQDVIGASNLFDFLYKIFRTFKISSNIYLIISITPYTFFSYILLLIFRKKVFVYLRSSGYEEYRAILGFIGPIIYHIMFKVVTYKSIIITCQSRLFEKEKKNIVFPSELNSTWLQNTKIPPLDKPRLLYVGRVKIEKGIFSLLKIFEELNIDANLSIVGKKESENINSKKVNYIGHGFDFNELIKIYDEHNIFILPSFTEAHPKVLDEALSRKRPVIIFEDIRHVVQNRNGIFVSQRNLESLVNTIEFIMKDYKNIQQSMNKNKLPTKKDFVTQMNNILKNN